MIEYIFSISNSSPGVNCLHLMRTLLTYIMPSILLDFQRLNDENCVSEELFTTEDVNIFVIIGFHFYQLRR